MGLRYASPGGVQISLPGKGGGDEVVWGIMISPESVGRGVQHNSEPTTMAFAHDQGRNQTEGDSQYGECSTKAGDDDERGDSGLDDLLCDVPETILVGPVIASVDGKIESVSPVDLNVY